VFLSLNSLTIAKHIRSSAWLEHGPFVFWLMEILAPRAVVELGTHNGFSFLTLCQSVKQMGIQSKIYAIDTWEGDEHAGFYSSDVFDALEKELQKLYPGIGLMIRSTFDEARSQFANGSIDLLHIDGRHRYEDVVHDFHTWKDALSDKGIVLFHDTRVQRSDFGVWKFWSEIEGIYPSFEFFHGHGLGVLAIGKTVPSIVLDLCRASFEEKTFTREVYSQLGSRNSLEYALNLSVATHQKTKSDLSEIIESCNKKKKDMAVQFDDLININNHMKRELSEKEKYFSLQLKKFTTELLHQENINNSILSSTSWRLTAPYRYVGHHLRCLVAKLFAATR